MSDDVRGIVVESNAAIYRRIKNTLWPDDPTYAAEPLDIEDARWLIYQLERLKGYHYGVRRVLNDLEDIFGLKDEL